MSTRRFTGKYADDGKASRLRVRAESGHRCIRCGHPFESGKHGKGEWSPCDEKCAHDGPLRFMARCAKQENWMHEEKRISRSIAELIGGGSMIVEAQWRVLTVHHLDGQKDNDAWWNTLALCQRCHLQIQTTVDPRVPWFLEHSAWFRIYAAGFYAFKYEGKLISKEEAESRKEELLSYERRT